MIAQVAVSDSVYAIDRPYSYRVPDGLMLRSGMRVLVPFGNGNRKKEAVVLAVSAGEEAKLKAVEQALDEEPVLTAEQLRLAGFLRERYFCTYYDAVKAILPAGLWFRRQETFALTPEAADMPEDGSLAGQLVQFLRELGGSATDAALRQRFPDEEQLALTIKTLKAKKMLTSSLDLTRRGGVKTQKLAALAVPAEDAMDFARRKQRAAPLQKAVLELLCAVGSGSAQEICELTGASMPTLRRLEKLELITISEQPVFRQAVRQCAVFLDEYPAFSMAVNLSCLQLEDPTLVEYLAQTLREEGMSAEHIIVELTESYLAPNLERLSGLLAQMRGLGLRVAMDDFGTGYSSLSVLKHAPVDIVKIDRSFVQGLCGSAFDHSFVHLMVELCHSVGIRVCVEGVETTAELAALQPFGADYLQGFLLGHPEPAARFAPLFL